MADMEKITINITPVDLGRIDMLVEEGFYQNRSDFIRASIRRELDAHGEVLTAKAARHKVWQTGVLRLTRAGLEASARENVKQSLCGLGSLIVETDVPPSLVDWVFDHIRWYGTIDASQQVKAVISTKSG